jgi:hypothetical protein
MTMAGGIDWTALLSAVGGFGIGSIVAAAVTTYGGKGRQRRKARSKALTRLEKFEITRRTLPLAEGSYYDMGTFAALASTCMIAGVPRPVITLYGQVCEVGRRFTARDDPGGWHVSYKAVMASVSLTDDAAQLLRDTLWRPVLTFPRRSWRTWRLRRKALRLYGDFWPSTLPQNTYSTWLAEAKANKKAQQIASGHNPQDVPAQAGQAQNPPEPTGQTP